MPKVRVIVLSCNIDKYVELCIHSIIAQNIQDIEIVLINDGSADGSDYTCRKYCAIESGITYIKRKTEGVGEARNMGLKERPRNDFLVDVDDYLPENVLEK